MRRQILPPLLVVGLHFEPRGSASPTLLSLAEANRETEELPDQFGILYPYAGVVQKKPARLPYVKTGWAE